MGGVLPVFIHPHRLEGLVHPAADFGGLHPVVLQGKGHVLLHNGGDDLVVRILEDHPHPLADVVEVLFLPGVHPFYQDPSPHGQEDGVEMLGEGALPGAVVPQNGQELARGDLQGDLLQHQPGGILLLVSEGNLLRFNDLVHSARSSCGALTPGSRWRWSRRAGCSPLPPPAGRFPTRRPSRRTGGPPSPPTNIPSPPGTGRWCTN